MKQVLTSLKNRFETDKEYVFRTLLLSEGFGFCFSLSCVCGFILDKYDTAFPSAGIVFGGLCVAILLTQLISFVLLSFIVFFEGKEKTTAGKSDCETVIRPRIWIIGSIVTACAWLPVYLAYFPSIFSYDGEAQLSQVISGMYSTHHPLIHTLFMGWCMNAMYSHGGINAGMTLYSGIQLLLMSAIMGWTYAELYRVTQRLKPVIIYGVFICLFPVHAILAVSTTKDVLFSGGVLIFILLMRRCVENGYIDNGSDDSKSLNNLLLIKILLSSVIMLLLRNNAQYALLILVVFLLIYKRPWKIIAVLSLSIVIATLAGTGLKGALNAQSGSPREALSVPIQQMARTCYLHGDEFDDATKADVSLILDEEAISRYDEHLADPVKERISMKQPTLLVKTWLKLGRRYPGCYFDAWLLTTEGAWYVRDTSCNRIYGEGSATGFGYLSTDLRWMPEGFQVTNESLIPALRSALEKLVSDNSFEKIPVVRLAFAPSLYFWMVIGYVYFCLVKRKYNMIVPVVFLLTYYLTILMSPAILVRYMYPYMLAVIIPFMGVTGREK